ncbi:MAG TPA: response regulator [Herpetosiphonaceae bacterium]
MAAPRSVLVVEPDSTLHRNLSAMIRACGYRALIAATGEAAAGLARQESAAIGGIMLEPEGFGAQLPGLLRELRQHLAGPLIFISTLGPSEVARRAKRATIAYLAKPFGVPELRVALTLIFGSQDQPALTLVEADAPAPPPTGPTPAAAYAPAEVSEIELDALWAE